MFILDAFVTLRESYLFYFTSFSFIGISLFIAAIRCTQALYKLNLNKWWHLLIECSVEIIRILQFIFILAVLTDTPIKALNSTPFRDKISLNLYDMAFPAIYWAFAGFAVVFGVYNLLLYIVFSKHTIAGFMQKKGLSRFSVESTQQALIQVYKNVLIIPVGFIYILIILKVV